MTETLALTTPLRAIAVMGDLVDSEGAPSRAELHRRFNAAVEMVNERLELQLLSPLTITLGDEFQGLANSLSAGMAMVRQLRTSLLFEKIQCRFVLGFVTIETPLNRSRAWNMLGEGLAETRTKLEEKSGLSAYRFHLPPEYAVAEQLLEAVGRSLSEIERGWTDRQLEVVKYHFEGGASVEVTADLLKITPRVVYKIRQAARLDFYQAQWDAMNFATGELNSGLRLDQ